MATYTKTTNFTAKDNLTSGDPAKVIKGSEFDTEFNAIETAVNSKANANNGTHTGTTTIATANIDTLQIDGVTVTSTSAELNKLDGFTGDVTDLNKLASVTATATEINVLDGSTATTADLNKLAGVTATSTELNLLDGVTATTAELNFVDGVTSNIQTQLDNKQPLDAQLTDIAGLTPTDGTFIVGNGINFVAESGDTAIASLGITATATELNTLDGITATTAELNITDGLTATTAELNVLDGITATTTELNYTDGVTSNIQTQLDTKAPIASPTFTGTATIPTVDINGGNIDGVQIGTTTPNAGVFSTLNANSSFEAPNIDDNATKVDLKNGGATKLSTTATGVDVTGTITADSVSVTQTGSTTALRAEKSQTGQIIVAYNGASVNYLDADTQYFRKGDGTKLGEFSGGDFHLYEDTGTTAKFVWDSSAESLGIGTSPSAPLHVKGGSISTPATASAFISNATSRLVVNHANEYGVYVGYANSSNDAIGVQSARSNGVTSPLLLNPYDGNVGIGTSSPSNKLAIYESSTGNAGIDIDNTQSGTALTLGKQGSTAYGATSAGDGVMYVYDASLSIMADGGAGNTSSIKFSTGGNSERARIDSSGNLLVGKTSANSNLQGCELRPEFGVFTSTSNPAVISNRKSSDGVIHEFQKDGSTVGSIGTNAATMYLSAPQAGGMKYSYLTSTNAVMLPVTTTGANADGTHDLGLSNSRFKDLYLSGGVYLGGTGSANKLDDYEEGNFTADITPTSGSVTLSSSNLRYVKVGSSVTVGGRLTVGSVSSPTGAIQVTLPFQANLYSLYYGIKVGIENSVSKNYNDFSGLVFSGTSTFRIYLADTNGLSSSAANAQQLQSGTNIDLSFTYMTNS